MWKLLITKMANEQVNNYVCKYIISIMIYIWVGGGYFCKGVKFATWDKPNRALKATHPGKGWDVFPQTTVLRKRFRTQ